MPPPSNGQAMVPVEHLRPVSRARSEASGVEQSRAVAEVQAAVLVAQQCPRDVELAKDRMRRACDEYALASRAFYRYDRGDGVVNDASIHLARELAACWGNNDYGIAELHRNEEERYSEMKAWAWDQETNTRPSTTFIVPHARDAGGRRRDLTSLRDVYENNANMGGRRVRQMIFAILPVWFVEEAKTRCRATLERGDGRPLEERITSAVERFAGLGVSPERMEQRLGRPRDRWNAVDLAELTITFQSISRGERAVEDEFPPQRITVDEITAAAPYAGGQDSSPGRNPSDSDPGGAAPGSDPSGPYDRPEGESGATPATPDPPASTDPDAVTVDQLMAAAIAAGKVNPKAKKDAQAAALAEAAAELVGVHVFLLEELVADQAVAEELLAKLTPAAES